MKQQLHSTYMRVSFRIIDENNSQRKYVLRKGLDTVESLLAGAARDPNRNMYGNRNNYLHFCDIHSFQY